MVKKTMVDALLKNTAAAVEEKFCEVLPETNEGYSSVVEAMRYSFLGGGKRIRPALLLEFCKLFGGSEEEALPFAVALEMIHTYSLIHDDLPCMDNDDMRRGRPSCHKQFSEDIALLAGDALLTHAFTVSASSIADNDRKIKAIGVLSRNAGYSGMIGGQVIDLAIENTPCETETVREMYLLKTGELLSAACEIGAIIGGADDEKIKMARQYAFKVGLAFQIIDDILDNIGDEKLLGKPIGSDAKNNKTTFVSKYGIEECRSIAAKLSAEAKEILVELSGDNASLIAITDYLLNRKY